MKQCKQLKEPRSLLQIGEKPYGEPWKKDWKSFLPAQYSNRVSEQDYALVALRDEPSMNGGDFSDDPDYVLNQSMYGQSRKRPRRAEDPSSHLLLEVQEHRETDEGEKSARRHMTATFKLKNERLKKKLRLKKVVIKKLQRRLESTQRREHAEETTDITQELEKYSDIQLSF